jgi:hypothetical protein
VERHALRPLPERPLVVRHRRSKRRVANDAFVDIETVRYSVPFRLVRAHVAVLVGDDSVEVLLGAERRYERGSLLITTNQVVTQWGAVFGDDVLAAAIGRRRMIDRSCRRFLNAGARAGRRAQSIWFEVCTGAAQCFLASVR